MSTGNEDLQVLSPRDNSAPQPMGGQTQIQHPIMRLMSAFSLETTPGAAAKIPDYRRHIEAGAPVYITFLAGSDFKDTLAVAARLSSEGFKPIPHIAARSLPDRDYLDDILGRLSGELGVEQVLCIAGGVDTPVGEFSDTMQLLETGLFDRHGIRTIGVAGHPEGSPDINDEAIQAALKWKNAFNERSDASLYIATQFCFEAAPIIAWDRALRASGNRLPIYIGIPGPASVKSLLNHARACGVGPSMRFLTRQARNITKLLTVSTPDRLVSDLAHYTATDPQHGIRGVHMYPLGGLSKTTRWAYAASRGKFSLHPNGKGFDIQEGGGSVLAL